MRPAPTPVEVSITDLSLGELAGLWWSQTWRQCVLLALLIPILSVVSLPLLMRDDMGGGWLSVALSILSIVLTIAAGLAYWYSWLGWTLRSGMGPVRIAVIRDRDDSVLAGPWCGTGMYPAQALYEDQALSANGRDA